MFSKNRKILLEVGGIRRFKKAEQVLTEKVPVHDINLKRHIPEISEVTCYSQSHGQIPNISIR